MGIFSIKPKSKNELKAYEVEKSHAQKVYKLEYQRARLQGIKEQARFDALPRTERVKQRLSTGLSKVKTGIAKLQAFEEKHKTSERQERRLGATPPLLSQNMNRTEMGEYEGGIIQQSMRQQQGGGLIQQSLQRDVSVQGTPVLKRKESPKVPMRQRWYS